MSNLRRKDSWRQSKRFKRSALRKNKSKRWKGIPQRKRRRKRLRGRPRPPPNFHAPSAGRCSLTTPFSRSTPVKSREWGATPRRGEITKRNAPLISWNYRNGCSLLSKKVLSKERSSARRLAAGTNSGLTHTSGSSALARSSFAPLTRSTRPMSTRWEFPP